MTQTRCGFTLTKVAVGRNWHEIRVREVLVSDLVRAVVVHLHVHQGLVPLLYSNHACREGGRRDVPHTHIEFDAAEHWRSSLDSYLSSYKLQELQTPRSGSLW